MQRLFKKWNNTKWYKLPKEELWIIANKLSEQGNCCLEVSEFVITKLIPLLDEIYQDNYHLELIVNTIERENKPTKWWINGFNLILRFPQLTITNEKGDSTTVHELFVRKCFSIGSFGIYTHSDIWGMLMKPTISQYLRGYNHSHLTSSTYTNSLFSKFCTGSNDYTQNLLKINHDSTIEDWEQMLLFLRVFVETESLEGKPHIRLRDLNLNNPFILKDWTIPQWYITRFESYLNSEDRLPSVNWSLNSDGNLEVVDDEDLEDCCLEVLKLSGNFENSQVSVLKDDLGNYFQYKIDLQDTIEAATYSYIFQGVTIPFEIINKESLVNNKVYIHPKIKQYVKQHFEQQVRNQLVIEYCKTHE